MVDLDFYKSKKVLVTGHTGFKGSWMCQVLIDAGAQVTGFALEPPTEPNLFEVLQLDERMTSVIGDVRNLKDLNDCMQKCQPDIVIHMAAQPIVRDGYKDPVYTYETNVMGTVHILEAVRHCDSVRSFVNVTTDKVYLNNEWVWGYRENDRLDGYDPYSNSKSCSELVTSSYQKSFFQEEDKVAISTARAGNVIGGGDFANDRIVPDCFRAAQKGEEIIIRNPASTRPFQHVLEPVLAYLYLAQKQYHDRSLAGSYNIGPNDEDCICAQKIVELFCANWKGGLSWKIQGDGGPHEANLLKLDCSKIRAVLSWEPRWNIEQALEKTVEWYRVYFEKKDIVSCMRKQIKEYMSGE